MWFYYIKISQYFPKRYEPFGGDINVKVDLSVPVDLSELSDVVKNDVATKTVYDKLVAKVNSIDTSGFVLKTNYDADKKELENKIPNTSGLVKKQITILKSLK